MTELEPCPICSDAPKSFRYEDSWHITCEAHIREPMPTDTDDQDYFAGFIAIAPTEKRATDWWNRCLSKLKEKN